MACGQKESSAMDAYLKTIGYDEIAWIGPGLDFLPEDTFGFTREKNTLTAYQGESKKLTTPDYTIPNALPASRRMLRFICRNPSHRIKEPGPRIISIP